MSATVWITVGGLCLATAVIKAFGPVVFGGRSLPPALGRIIPLLAPALLAALVITETFGGDRASLVIDARAGGVAVAGIAIARRAPLPVVVLLAAGATAALRAL
ncbi:MAG TPA: AzlD domain-containing protein [Solirubrobacteraceae bacterium]|jgi:branched-subunit amino acid transport protein